MGRAVLPPLCVFALGVVLLVGCQEVVHTVALTVTVVEAPSFEDIVEGPPLAGVELCEADTANCETTDSVGFASIRLPANRAVSYTLSKDGYVPYLIGDVTDETFTGATSGPWPMARDESAEDFSGLNMIPYPWQGGRVVLRTFPAAEGVTFDLVGQRATAYYATEDGVPTLGLTATTSDGQGGFFQVTAGEYQFEFGGAATGCVPGLARPGDSATRIDVSVRVGYFNFGSMNCDEP